MLVGGTHQRGVFFFFRGGLVGNHLHSCHGGFHRTRLGSWHLLRLRDGIFLFVVVLLFVRHQIPPYQL